MSPFEVVSSILQSKLENEQTEKELDHRTVSIPVCYGGEYGPDLEYVARHHNLTPEEVISIHSEGEYLAYMIGFAPGFPFLGGLSEKLLRLAARLLAPLFLQVRLVLQECKQECILFPLPEDGS